LEPNDNTPNEWHGYRVIKTRLIVLLIGWIPFGTLLGIGSPVIFGSYKPAYFFALAYVLFMAYTWLMYGLYPCPTCGNALRGRQLYSSTCRNCGAPINPKYLPR